MSSLGDCVVIGFVGLAEIGGVGVGMRALQLHPVDGGAGVEAAGEGDADLFADGQMFEDVRHVTYLLYGVGKSADGAG
jgi:hypothetical protein